FELDCPLTVDFRYVCTDGHTQTSCPTTTYDGKRECLEMNDPCHPWEQRFQGTACINVEDCNGFCECNADTDCEAGAACLNIPCWPYFGKTGGTCRFISASLPQHAAPNRDLCE